MINLGFYSGKGYDVRYRRSLVDYVLLAVAFVPVLADWFYIFYMNKQTDGAFLQEHGVEGIMALVLFLVLGSAAYVPVRFFNFAFRVTEANIGRQYVLAIRLCQVVNILMGCMFLGGLLGKDVACSVYFYAGASILMVVAMVAYFILAYRMR
ncbi:hypothetical protein [Mediterranea massiliensis]|jgi:hypothetical protein|uniref:hypothetical protein n=1 Tax=Mediterranea massiliensis TaxID=1841865 RepID=UPI0025A49773|nr:hypothetical protein [Mediterranea massiliensis]MDM8338468.1 hypothetical protein [Mediterranea massiliensis]